MSTAPTNERKHRLGLSRQPKDSLLRSIFQKLIIRSNLPVDLEYKRAIAKMTIQKYGKAQSKERKASVLVGTDGVAIALR